MKNVMTFRGEFGFLSNMYSVDFAWDGRVYHSSEAAFQSAKSLDPEERARFAKMSGVVAKREGKKIKLRRDWEAVKDQIMEEVVRAKFSQNPDLMQKLIDTGDLHLMEGNRWHDTYWGVDAATGRGENRLGEILMKVRAELGGADYRAKVEKQHAEQAEIVRKARAEIEQKIAQAQAELNAIPQYDFVGKEVDTKAFGRVMILRQEGKYLTFNARGAEKKFVLPGCIAQGFMLPDDPEVVKNCKLQQELLDLLEKMRKEAVALQQE